MKASRRMGALVSAGVACAAALVVTPSASAVDWDHWMYTEDGDPGGVVYFKTYGDIVRVCDIEADGFSVLINVWSSKGGYSLEASKNGNCEQVGANTASFYNLPEKEWIDFRIWLKNPYGTFYYDEASWWNG